MMTMLLLSKKILRFQNQLGCNFSTFFQWAKKNEYRNFARLIFHCPIFFSFFWGFRVGANDILSIELNFLSIYKGTFRSFFPNGGKKQNRKQPPNFFFKTFFPTFRCGADDILSIDLHFLSIYKAAFRTFFFKLRKKTKSQTASQLFFLNFFSHISFILFSKNSREYRTESIVRIVFISIFDVYWSILSRIHQFRLVTGVYCYAHFSLVRMDRTLLVIYYRI